MTSPYMNVPTRKRLKFIKGHTPEIVYNVLKEHKHGLHMREIIHLSLQNGAKHRVYNIIQWFLKNHIVTKHNGIISLIKTDAEITPGKKLSNNKIINEINELLNKKPNFDPTKFIHPPMFTDILREMFCAGHDALRSEILKIIKRQKEHNTTSNQENNRLHRLIDKCDK